MRVVISSQDQRVLIMIFYAIGTAENESGSAKHENGTRHPWYRRSTFMVLVNGEKKYDQRRLPKN
jgi:hypothetical protein